MTININPIKNTNETVQDEFSYTKQKTSIQDIDDVVKQLISDARSNLEKLQYQNGQKQEIQDQLDKMNSPKLVIIPTKNGNKRYYSIADSAGGVTKKTCLIDESTLKNNLQGLAGALSFEEVKQNKILMNAILKHPKAGKDTEVQREAIGLKIARLLGFTQVTDSTLVNHDIGNGSHPYLFVPFGKMELLSDSINNANSMHGKIKQEYSQVVEDFGKYSAFFMLCGDPDFIGKAGQNKGLAGEEYKQLYIFDQVFMTTNNLGLDRSFNLVPTNILSKAPNFIARHFMGRNKSVINDSSFEEKIQGAIGVIQKKEEIKKMFAEVARANSNMRDDPLVKTLQKDAKDCLKSFNARIHSIEKLFPPVRVDGLSKKVGDLVKNQDYGNLEILKKSMLLTQLVNKPKMYDKSGKPYRAPFFTSSSTYVKQVSIQDDQVTLSFSRRFSQPLSENKKEMLTQHGFAISNDGKSATISKAELLKLNEQNYFKEQENTINPGHNYIDSKKIKTLANIYNESDDRIQRIISNPKKFDNKAAALQDALNQLDKFSFKNKGFTTHVKQCFLYEAMKVIIESNPDVEQQFKNYFQRAKQDGTLESYVREELNSIVMPSTKEDDYSQHRFFTAFNAKRPFRDSNKQQNHGRSL